MYVKSQTLQYLSPEVIDVIYIGMDTHKDYYEIVEMDKEGNILDEKRLSSDLETLKEYAAQLPSGCELAFEASWSWRYIVQIFRNHADLHMAHPMKARGIVSSKRKTDRLDARNLAHLLRTRFLPESYIPPKEIMEYRDLFRHKISLTHRKTETKNRIQNVLLSNGIKHDFSDLFGKAGIQYLRSIELNDADRILINSELNVLEILENEIEAMENHIHNIVKGNTDFRLLMTIPGVNSLSALICGAEIGDVKRFPTPKNLVGAAGLAPSIRSSGGKERHGHITKQGSKWLRWILVQNCLILIKYPGKIKEFYARLKKRKGHKIAIVACARKLLTIIWHMLMKGEPYQDGVEKLTNRKINAMKKKARTYPLARLGDGRASPSAPQEEIIMGLGKGVINMKDYQEKRILTMAGKHFS